MDSSVFDTAIAFIRRNENFVITAHETPDGDAVGAEIGAYNSLRSLGKNAKIINADPTPRIFEYIDSEQVISNLSDAAAVPQSLSDWCLLILDSNDINNIGAIREVILENVSEYFIIDHHEQDVSLRNGNLIVAQASSTCEVLYDLFKGLGVSYDLPTAIALFSGIVYDTGSFIYPKTSIDTFRIAEDLARIGVEPNYVYSKMYESNTVSSLLLQSLVLSTLTLHYDDQVAVQRLTSSALETSGAPFEEAQTLINVPLKSERIKVSIFFKENMEGILRCSMRSKGNIDVASIAKQYGGGGHKTAAGFKSRFPLEEIEKKVLENVRRFFL
ncbi:MAG: bifunctional oligoribonuclease/PAP phosphatase NrnA [Spirochaetales bacterium]|jgi:bifunctional oligoribonuclease and PAP phosphatase NrnA|nr:bifunctional oligoribonuclease/PAP phosphatase NrnA [Spirochaetales bacterium]